MSTSDSTNRSGKNNPYVEILSPNFLINADGQEVKRTKARSTRPAIIRFLEKIVVSESRFFEGTPCWEWQGCKSNGYGQFKKDGRRGSVKSSPHQFSHEYFIGPIPESFEVDHRCRNRGCGSPFHIEAVTLQENRIRRGLSQTHCKHGHETPIVDGKKRPKCIQCESIRILIYYAHGTSDKIKDNDRSAATRRLERAIAAGGVPLTLLGDLIDQYRHLL